MKYKQSSANKQIKKEKNGQNIQIKNTITQEWKVNTQNPKQLLPYSIKHIYLSTICNSFHTIKLMFLSNSHTTMKQILQKQKLQKTKIFSISQYIFISRLKYPFQKMKQLVMFSDEQPQSSQNQTGLQSYMRMIQLRKVMQEALSSLDPTYERIRRKNLLWGFLNLKDNLKDKKKHEAYNDQINIEYFSQKAEQIIRNLSSQVLFFAFQKLFSYSQFQSQQMQKSKSVKKHTFDTFGKSLQEQFQSISIQNESSRRKEIQKHYNRQNINSRQKKFINKAQNKNQVKQSIKREKMYININDDEEDYQQSNQIRRQNQLYQYQVNNFQQENQRNIYKNKNHQKSRNINKKNIQKQDLQDKINQMPTQRTNYRYSHQEEHFNSKQQFQQDNNSQKYSTPFHRIQCQHAPITQRIQKKEFRSEQYIENNQQLNSDSEQEQNIVQQIYIIRNHKQKPKRKPDHFVKVPILSSDINVVEIQNPKKKNYQYQFKSQAFYRQHVCKDCKYCKKIQNMHIKIGLLKKMTSNSLKLEGKTTKIYQKVSKLDQFVSSNVGNKNQKQ